MIPQRTRAQLLLPLFLAAGVVSLTACGGDSTSPDSEPPVVTIDAPADGSSFDLGEAITMRGSATDPEDGALTGDALSWTSDLDGELGTGGEITVDNLRSGAHTIRLTATDSDGVVGSTTVGILVRSPPAQVIGR